MTLLQVRDLKTFFYTRNGIVRAVDGVSFDVEPNETLAIVGESGSGKSVTAYSILGLIPKPPGKIESGAVIFNGADLIHTTRRNLQRIRGNEISMIFQDPMTSLNPFLSIGEQLVEPLLLHSNMTSKDALDESFRMLDRVGIMDGKNRLKQYPHEFSGGMRQRVMIAMALITQPKLLIADEPTTALDVTVQSQILNLMMELKEQVGMSIIFITHDLGVVARVADRVNVMYAGKIVESSISKNIFKSPKHPYTSALLRSLPSNHQKGEILEFIKGHPPDLISMPEGCRFKPRCEFAKNRCSSDSMNLNQITANHQSACGRMARGEI